MNNMNYAGFWIRVGASLIDSLLVIIITGPILTMIYGQEYWIGGKMTSGAWDVVVSYLLPAIAIILFWVYRSATPGKMALKLSIVDADTGHQPSVGQLIGRYFGYFVSMLPLMLGIIWVGIDRRKQGWHDKLAGTVVIRNTTPEPVEFGTKSRIK